MVASRRKFDNHHDQARIKAVWPLPFVALFGHSAMSDVNPQRTAVKGPKGPSATKFVDCCAAPEWRHDRRLHADRLNQLPIGVNGIAIGTVLPVEKSRQCGV
jgi:hypothetical protein